MTMRSTVSVIVVLALAGCSGPAEKARKKYEFLKSNGGTLGEVCDAGREMLAAQAEVQDKGQPMDRPSVNVDCMMADQQGRGMPANRQDAAYSIEPDNMDALPDTVSASPSRASVPASDRAESEPTPEDQGYEGNEIDS